MKEITPAQRKEIRTKWVKSLIESPSYKQRKGALGMKSRNGSYQACCLGELCLIATEVLGENIASFNEDEILYTSSGKHHYPDEEFAVDQFKMFSSKGALRPNADLMSFKTKDDKLITVPTLAYANDSDVSWKEIGKFIDKRPDLIFEDPENYTPYQGETT